VRDPVLRVPRRTLAITAGVVLFVVATALLMVTGVLARVTDPSTVAAAPVIATHQAAVERDVERAYDLHLPISERCATARSSPSVSC
jgi:hypothetical protein